MVYIGHLNVVNEPNQFISIPFYHAIAIVIGLGHSKENHC